MVTKFAHVVAENSFGDRTFFKLVRIRHNILRQQKVRTAKRVVFLLVFWLIFVLFCLFVLAPQVTRLLTNGLNKS